MVDIARVYVVIAYIVVAMLGRQLRLGIVTALDKCRRPLNPTAITNCGAINTLALNPHGYRKA